MRKQTQIGIFCLDNSLSTKKKFAFKSCMVAWPGLTFKKSFWYEFWTNTKKISNQKVIFNKYSVLISIKFNVVMSYLRYLCLFAHSGVLILCFCLLQQWKTTPKSTKQNNHLSFWFSSLKIKKRSLHMTLEIQLLAWYDLNLTLGGHRFYYLAPLSVLDPICLF
jgi:hypothetical protein